MNDIMKNGKCLMIKTKDRRKFFTHEKNYIQLLEFSKLFKAEVSVVAVKEAEVLDLEQLAPAICDANFIQQQPSELEIIEVKLPQNKRNRGNILKSAKKITNYISKQFEIGEVVSLKELTKKFQKMDVTLACLCNHISTVRKKLVAEGKKIKKIGGGKYQLIK